VECGDLTSTPAGLPGWGPRFTAFVRRDLSRPVATLLATGRQRPKRRQSAHSIFAFGRVTKKRLLFYLDAHIQ